MGDERDREISRAATRLQDAAIAYATGREGTPTEVNEVYMSLLRAAREYAMTAEGADVPDECLVHAVDPLTVGNGVFGFWYARTRCGRELQGLATAGKAAQVTCPGCRGAFPCI